MQTYFLEKILPLSISRPIGKAVSLQLNNLPEHLRAIWMGCESLPDSFWDEALPLLDIPYRDELVAAIGLVKSGVFISE